MELNGLLSSLKLRDFLFDQELNEEFLSFSMKNVCVSTIS